MTDALCSVIFTPTAVLKAIKKTKNNNTCGPDGFSSTLVKNITNALALPLSIIFESFMSVGKTPSASGNAIITPIFKNGLALNQKITDQFHLLVFSVKSWKETLHLSCLISS